LENSKFQQPNSKQSDQIQDEESKANAGAPWRASGISPFDSRLTGTWNFEFRISTLPRISRYQGRAIILSGVLTGV
jgi:hypothetical protein